MAAVDLGSVVVDTWNGSPAGTIAATVTQPDGTSFAGSVVVTQATPATATFTPTMAGRHLVKFTSSGAAVGAYQDVVDVWPADDRFIISLQDAQDALTWPGVNVPPANLTDLRLYVASATPVIEDIVGSLVVYGQYTYTFDGGKPSVVLPGNVSSIVSVTELGYPVSLYVWDANSNVLSAGTTVAPRRFMPSVRGVVVTFMAGFQAVPPNIILGTRELIRHWWQIGKQGIRPSTAAQSTAMEFTPSGFAVPKRVIELCAATQHKSPAGFA